MSAQAPRRIDPPIEGMTWRRVQHAESLGEAVEHAGFHTALPPAGTAEPGVTRAERDAGLEEFRRRLVVSALPAGPAVALSLARLPLQLDNRQWHAFQLATPAVVGDAWSFRGSRERAIRWR